MKKKELKERIKLLENKLSSNNKERVEEKEDMLGKDLKLCKEILEKYGNCDLEATTERFGRLGDNCIYSTIYKLTLY